jgi:hypothetical protein
MNRCGIGVLDERPEVLSELPKTFARIRRNSFSGGLDEGKGLPWSILAQASKEHSYDL